MTTPIAAAVTGSWTKTGDLPAAASWHGQYDGAVLLKDGKGVVLLGGADGSGAATNKVARYDIAEKKWTAGATSLAFPRRLHTVTRLDDGTFLVVGGTSGSGPHAAGLTAVEKYDPADGSLKTVASLHEARRGHSAVLLESKKVLVAGGLASRTTDSDRALATAEIYDPATDKWTPTKHPMTDARGGHGAVLFKGGKVLVTGGTAPVSKDGSTSLAYCELYDPTGDSWSPVASLAQPRSRHRTVLASDTTALVIGGETPGTAGDGTYDPYHALTVERFDLAAGTWTARPSTAGGRALHAVVPLGSGKFLVAGGTTDEAGGIGYQSALIYDDTGTGGWSAAAGLTEGRWAGAATALAAGTALVTGGIVASGIAAADPTRAELTATTEVFSFTATPPALGGGAA
ncbi:Kelch repeat-containing protein [Streptomyces phaeochromogenes]|uniref:Kelch repeat-containing protein n=1 Tax=Streptomyces phaeochromogenes TaxID=1923 RepID=UPI0036CAE4E4